MARLPGYTKMVDSNDTYSLRKAYLEDNYNISYILFYACKKDNDTVLKMFMSIAATDLPQGKARLWSYYWDSLIHWCSAYNSIKCLTLVLDTDLIRNYVSNNLVANANHNNVFYSTLYYVFKANRYEAAELLLSWFHKNNFITDSIVDIFIGTALNSPSICKNERMVTMYKKYMPLDKLQSITYILPRITEKLGYPKTMTYPLITAIMKSKLLYTRIIEEAKNNVITNEKLQKFLKSDAGKLYKVLNSIFLTNLKSNKPTTEEGKQ